MLKENFIGCDVQIESLEVINTKNAIEVRFV